MALPVPRDPLGTRGLRTAAAGRRRGGFAAAIGYSGAMTAADRLLYAFEADDAVFVAMDRAAYHRSIFLDARISPAREAAEAVPLASLAVPAAVRAPGWIFHVAHCGSTLLARALDDPAGEIVLREPLALRQLGVAAANGGDVAARLRLAAARYGCGYGTAARPVVKANVPVNFIAGDLLALDPAAPAIFLSFGLEAYLAAILRGPNHRAWVRRITAELRPALERWAGPGGSGDAETAAWLWLAQARAHAAAVAGFPNARTLDAATLFARPRATVAAAHALFGRPLSDAGLDAIVAGPLFATYSKQPGVPFDDAARLARQTAAMAMLAAEIAAARAWVTRRASDYPVAAVPGPAL